MRKPDHAPIPECGDTRTARCRQKSTQTTRTANAEPRIRRGHDGLSTGGAKGTRTPDPHTASQPDSVNYCSTASNTSRSDRCDGRVCAVLSTLFAPVLGHSWATGRTGACIIRSASSTPPSRPAAERSGPRCRRSRRARWRQHRPDPVGHNSAHFQPLRRRQTGAGQRT